MRISRSDRRCPPLSTQRLVFKAQVYHACAWVAQDKRPKSDFHCMHNREGGAWTHLVILGRVTSFPSLMAAWKLWAPKVSMAMTGTSSQPTSCSPWTTPHSRPPPPTESTMAPGLALSVSFNSLTMEVWPSLGRRRVAGQGWAS